MLYAFCKQTYKYKCYSTITGKCNLWQFTIFIHVTQFPIWNMYSSGLRQEHLLPLPVCTRILGLAYMSQARIEHESLEDFKSNLTVSTNTGEDHGINCYLNLHQCHRPLSHLGWIKSKLFKVEWFRVIELK